MAMNFIVAFVILCALCCDSVSSLYCFQWGSDMDACLRLKPEIYSQMKELTDREYFKISVNSETVYPGQKAYVRIMSKSTNVKSTFEGLFLTVMQSGKAVGSWDEMHPSTYRHVSCMGNKHAAIAEANNTDKSAMFVEDDVFVWNAPDTCAVGDVFELKATVVKSITAILTGLSIRLTCVSKPPGKKPASACANKFDMGVPSETSFETGYGGWWNDPMAPLRMTRHSGPTESMFTGPSSAFDGKYYVYAEASYPAKEGDEAILNSPPGLNGCFCVRINCHAWMGKGAYFVSRVNGEDMWVHAKSDNSWLQGWQSVNDPNFPVVQLVMHRGEDFRGDIAFDDIQILPGLCPEDMAGGGLPKWEKMADSNDLW